MLSSSPPPGLAVKNVTVDHISTQYLNTAFQVTGSFQLVPLAVNFAVDGITPGTAITVQSCKFKFPHPAFKARGGETVTVTIMGASAKSNLFPVV